MELLCGNTLGIHGDVNQAWCDTEMWKADLEFFFWATESLTAFFWLEPFEGRLQDRGKTKEKEKGMDRKEVLSVEKK